MGSETKSILTNVYPLVNKSMQTNSSKYKKVIQSYFSSRSEQIYDIGPMGRIYFGANEIEEYFKALQISVNDVQAAIDKTYYAAIASFNPRAAKDPFTATQVMVVRYYLLKGSPKDMELASIYLAFSGKFYPSIHYKYFPVVSPSEYRHVMEYVINNELSHKFDLKREGSLFNAIKSICNTWIASYSYKLKSGNDEDVVYVIQQLHNRICSFVVNIAQVYYDVYNNKDKFFSYDSDNLSDDDFHLADSNSLRSNKFIENSMNSILTNGINYKYCKMSADQYVKVDELKNILETIQGENSNIPLLRELISIIIDEYVSNTNDKSLKNIPAFISYTIAAKPNTKNKNIIREKAIIEKFLDENSPSYRKRKSREATKNSYFKSVLKYYTIVISQVNK